MAQSYLFSFIMNSKKGQTMEQNNGIPVPEDSSDLIVKFRHVTWLRLFSESIRRMKNQKSFESKNQ